MLKSRLVFALASIAAFAACGAPEPFATAALESRGRDVEARRWSVSATASEVRCGEDGASASVSITVVVSSRGAANRTVVSASVDGRAPETTAVVRSRDFSRPERGTRMRSARRSFDLALESGAAHVIEVCGFLPGWSSRHDARRSCTTLSIGVACDAPSPSDPPPSDPPPSDPPPSPSCPVACFGRQNDITACDEGSPCAACEFCQR